MSKIIKYELRRMIWNQFVLCMVAVLLLYGWLLLSGDVIQGIANTAPFSPWSFGYYISRLTPIVCLGELLMILLYASRKEKMVSTITSPTPFKKTTYLLIRSGVIVFAMLLASFLGFVLAIGFSGVFFHEYPVINYVLPYVVTVVPLVIFCLGTGVFLSKRNPLLLILLGGILLIGLIPSIDLYEMQFYISYPDTLKALDPGFHIPVWLFGKQVVLCIVGIAFYFSEYRYNK